MVRTYETTRRTSGDTDVLNLTDEVARRVKESGVRHGQVLVFTPGSTASVTTIEFEPGVMRDLRDAIERMAPRDIPYEHHARWGDANGHSHVRAALMGPSLVVPVVEGEPVLGTWQQVVLLDFDNHPRQRRVIIQVTGE